MTRDEWVEHKLDEERRAARHLRVEERKEVADVVAQWRAGVGRLEWGKEHRVCEGVHERVGRAVAEQLREDGWAAERHGAGFACVVVVAMPSRPEGAAREQVTS